MAMSYNALMYKLQKLQNDTNQQQMQFNREEASTARTWQTEMSNTAHQREVKDLKKAGLNPVLSTNSGGAMSYTTSSASASPESGASALANVYGAHTSAMATRSAAATSARATMYAANMSYMAAARQAQAQEFTAQKNYDAQMDKPASSLWGLIDKRGEQLVKTTMADKTVNDRVKNFVRDLNATINPNRFFKDTVKLNRNFSAQKSYDSLTVKGRFDIKKALINAGYVPTKYAIMAVAYTYATGKPVNWNRWLIRNRS